MGYPNNLRGSRSCVFLLHVHWVFVTKYRKAIFKKIYLQEMKAIFERVCNGFEAVLVGFDGEVDHVHLLVDFPPKVAI